MGVTRQAVSKWESGQAVPDALMMAQICRALHASADYLLLGIEPEADGATEAEPELPGVCPCCGRTAGGTVCPVCGYPIPVVPERGQKYALLVKRMREEIPDTTKFIIAQRISSVQDADLILVMDNGRIESSGTHEELLKTSTIYKEVYDSQNKAGGESHG